MNSIAGLIILYVFHQTVKSFDRGHKQPRSHTVVSDDRLALKSRFFSTEEDNAFNVEAVQNNISDLSS